MTKPFLVTNSRTLDAALFDMTGAFVAWCEDWDEASRFYTKDAAMRVADYCPNMPREAWHIGEELEAVTVTLNFRKGTVTPR